MEDPLQKHSCFKQELLCNVWEVTYSATGSFSNPQHPRVVCSFSPFQGSLLPCSTDWLPMGCFAKIGSYYRVAATCSARSGMSSRDWCYVLKAVELGVAAAIIIIITTTKNRVVNVSHFTLVCQGEHWGAKLLLFSFHLAQQWEHTNGQLP